MMPPIVLELVLGFVIGLSLGLLGGGGSILTVPALVYLVGQSPQAAVTTSLAIVGANSAVGVLFHHRARREDRKTLNWRVALIFASAGMLVSYLAAGLSKHLSQHLLMLLFALLMVIVGGIMLFQRRNAVLEKAAPELPEKHNVWLILVSGAGVGLLTGILGVGGGFLIVPALVMLVGLPMSQAVGTSLAIIAANSFAGLVGHLGGQMDVWITLLFVTAGIFGTYTGTKLAHRLPPHYLRQVFAIFVIVLAIWIMSDTLLKIRL